MDKNYHLGLLYLIHSLARVDGDFSEYEMNALYKVKANENIPNEVFREFERDIRNLKERDIYHKGLECIKECSQEKKIDAFATLYKISEIDGKVHTNEIKLLLNSIAHAGVEFDEVVVAAQSKNYFV